MALYMYTHIQIRSGHQHRSNRAPVAEAAQHAHTTKPSSSRQPPRPKHISSLWFSMRIASNRLRSCALEHSNTLAVRVLRCHKVRVGSVTKLCVACVMVGGAIMMSYTSSRWRLHDAPIRTTQTGCFASSGNATLLKSHVKTGLAARDVLVCSTIPLMDFVSVQS